MRKKLESESNVIRIKKIWGKMKNKIEKFVSYLINILIKIYFLTNIFLHCLQNEFRLNKFTFF